MEKMVAFVQLCLERKGELSDEEKKQWANRLEHELDQLEAFIVIILSIKEHGFINPFDFPEEYKNYTVDSPLPRMQHNHQLDDGRHRLSVLLALGVTHFPIYLMRRIKLGRRDDQVRRREKFKEEATNALIPFAESLEWEKYKETESYRLCTKLPEIIPEPIELIVEVVEEVSGPIELPVEVIEEAPVEVRRNWAFRLWRRLKFWGK